MRVVIIGQQDFGRAVLEAFLARGDEVVGVFVAPEKNEARPDPLRIAAQERKIAVYQMASLAGDEAENVVRSLNADIGVMAYVLQLVSANFASIPKLGMIQYHPSLLPKYRGPSSINWSVVCGETETGLTVFRPTEGIDEGPVVLQKTVPILPDDTSGSLYFGQLFPMGVQALLEATDMIASGNYVEEEQDESQAGYVGWFHDAESKINWNNHIDFIYNLIRGADPAPGAWTTFRGSKIRIYEAKKHLFHKFKDIKGSIGCVSEITEKSFKITTHGGQIEIFRLRLDQGKKISSPEFMQEYSLELGTKFGD